MPRVTFRDLANKQHGPSKAVRNFTDRPDDRFGWCQVCHVPFTSTDIEAGYCTQCGGDVNKKTTQNR